MPMTWNAEADAKLLIAIIKVYDVKVTGEKMKEVAEIMGPDCTAKAIQHRLAKLKTVTQTGGEGESEGETAEDAATPKIKTTKATKSGGAAKGKKGKKAATETTPPPAEEGEEGMITPPDTTSKKRAGLKRKSKSPTAAADDGEEENAAKKVKVEEGGEGEGEDGGISA